MTDGLGTWVYSLVCAALLCSLASAIAPKGRVKSALMIVCGVAMLAALLSPLKSIDFDEYSVSMAKYRAEAEDCVSEGEKYRENLNRLYIEEQCEAYILDKAAKVGAEISSVKVSAKWSDEGCWYPVSAKVSSACTEAQKKSIASGIEAELGIAEAQQTWNEG